MAYALYKEKDMKRMTKKISKRTYVTGAILVLLILSIAASVFFSKYNVSREIKNVRAMNAGLSKLASSLNATQVSKWKNESRCQITNAKQFGSRDHYFCEARYESEAARVDAGQVAGLVDSSMAQLKSLDAVESISPGGRYVDNDKEVYPYGLLMKDVAVNVGKCVINYRYDNAESSLYREMYCNQEESKSAYEELVKE